MKINVLFKRIRNMNNLKTAFLLLLRQREKGLNFLLLLLLGNYWNKWKQTFIFQFSLVMINFLLLLLLCLSFIKNKLKCNSQKGILCKFELSLWKKFNPQMSFLDKLHLQSLEKTHTQIWFTTTTRRIGR